MGPSISETLNPGEVFFKIADVWALPPESRSVTGPVSLKALQARDWVARAGVH